MYGEGNRVQRVGDGQELAQREEPYFNRSIMHFCSHRNTPNNGEVEGSAITVGKHGAYICWKLFSEYATVGDLITKEIFHAVLDLLLGERKTLQTNLPSQARVTLMDQTAERRLVNHLLFASLIKRGDGSIEVIEDVIPLYDVQVTVRPGRTIRRVYLAPQMEEIPFTQENGQVRYTVKKLENHQMVVMDY